MVAVDAKDFFAWRCNPKFLAIVKEKISEKVLSSMNQTNINLYMFCNEFLVKNMHICDEQWIFNYFPAKVSAGNEF